MNSVMSIYMLDPFMDDPKFNGFYGNFPLSLNTIPPVSERIGNWRVKRVAPTWVPPKVDGRVRSFHDYPCVNLSEPAYSPRAIEVLREFLEPNGEILPILTRHGTYYAFN